MATRLDLARRRRVVLDLLDRGLSYEEIAERVIELGMAPTPIPSRRRKPSKSGDPREPRYTRQDAWNDADAAMRAITDTQASERKALLARRLQLANRQMMRDLTDATSTRIDRARAASVIVRLALRESRLFGLDEPVRSQLEITQHVELLAAMSTQAIQAGAERAGLSDMQRQMLVAGMSDFLAGIERPDDRPLEIEGVVDAEVSDETG